MFQKFIKLVVLNSLMLLSFGEVWPANAQSTPAVIHVNNGSTDMGGSPDSYIGVGGAIGLNGNTTALGTGGVAILSKVRFTDNFSLHDATVLFGGGVATSMIVLTADLPIRDGSGQTIAVPFIGGGAMLRYTNGLSVSPAISGGVDIPLSRNFTGTVRVNAGFPSDRLVDVGVLVGVGYRVGN